MPAASLVRKKHAQGGRKQREADVKATLLAAVAACIISAMPAKSADTVRIGILWPLTGNAAAAGQASKAAAEVAADIVNNAHPELANLPLAAAAGLPNLGGGRIELVVADPPGNPSGAPQQALRLINEAQ